MRRRNMRLLLVYFSATGNTAKMAEVIGGYFKGLGVEVEELDITVPSMRQKPVDVAPYDAVLFGIPVHSNRAPKIVREWLGSLDGGGKKCSTFFTYGGFGIHPSHLSTREILRAQNFVVVSSAEFLGKHTFNLGGWKALEDRPDDGDFKIAKEYVDKTYRRFTGEDPSLVGELESSDHSEEELDNFENFRFMAVTQLPSRMGKECSMCMECEELCPTGAFDASTGEADRDRCIVCLRCVDICPEEAISINDLTQMWSMKLQMENETEETLKEKKSKIYL
jgi:ferredoxin